MFTKKIRALIDTSLNTGVRQYDLVRGEVFIGRFKNEQVFLDLVSLGVLEAADLPEEKFIPVIVREDQLSQIPSVWKGEIPMVLLDEDGQELPLSNLDLFGDVEK